MSDKQTRLWIRDRLDESGWNIGRAVQHLRKSYEDETELALVLDAFAAHVASRAANYRGALESISSMLHGSRYNCTSAMQIADKALAGWTGIYNPPSAPKEIEMKCPNLDCEFEEGHGSNHPCGRKMDASANQEAIAARKLSEKIVSYLKAGASSAHLEGYISEVERILLDGGKQ